MLNISNSTHLLLLELLCAFMLLYTSKNLLLAATPHGLLRFFITAVVSFNSENMLSTNYLLGYYKLTLFHLLIQQLFFELIIINCRFWWEFSSHINSWTLYPYRQKVAWAIQITVFDSIMFGLIPGRFLCSERISMPDFLLISYRTTLTCLLVAFGTLKVFI